MKRKKFLKRENYESINDDLGFDFGVVDHKKYWLEDVGYEVSRKEVDDIEFATNQLHQMCFAAIDNIINKNRFKELNIPEVMIPFIKRSWEKEEWSMYGRFDLCVKDGKIKMLEYNADTPTSLVEASLAQWKWMEGQNLPDQFNSIDEKLVAWWKNYLEEFKPSKVYFTTVKENAEDFRNTEYIMDAATRAGAETDFIFIEDMGSDGEFFYDMENNRIEHLFKLYPWEWLVNENPQFLDVILKENCSVIEPAWKMLLSNKAILAVLWELFPNHEYLLPTYFSPAKLGKKYVKKPFLSREGQNVEIVDGDNKETQAGLYNSEFNIYQAYFELPKIDDHYAVIGSWVVGEESCGIGIREDQSKITANMSCFAPHYICDDKNSTLTNEQKESQHKIAKQINEWKNEVDPNADKNWKEIEKDLNSGLAFNSDDLYTEKSTFGKDLIANLLMAAILILLAFFGFKSIGENNDKVKAKNEETTKFNSAQMEIKNKMFPIQKDIDADAWIKFNVSSKNQDLFKELYNLNKDLVLKGTTSKEDFFKIDERLNQIPFCIQDEKDVDYLNVFMNEYVLTTEEHKASLVYLKNKYNYDNNKIKIPTEEEILEFCDFKDFEKDLKADNDYLNQDKTTDKKVIVESYE